LADFLSCPQAFAWDHLFKTPGLREPPEREFFSPVYFGNAFGEAFAESLRDTGGLQGLLESWQSRLRRDFPAIEERHLPAYERYRLGRIETLCAGLPSEWDGLKAHGAGPSFDPEKELRPKLGDTVLWCRADLAFGNRLILELKLKRKSAFDVTGERTGPEAMLAKLLDPESAEGARYGLQILYYLLEARTWGAGAAVGLVNAFWETERAKRPKVAAWDTQTLEAFRGPFEKWIALYGEGFAKGESGGIIFPFWPHDNREGGRCARCPHQSLCLKDVPGVRLRHEALTAPLAAAFEYELEKRNPRKKHAKA